MIVLQSPINSVSFNLPGSDINFQASVSINNTLYPNSNFSIQIPPTIIIPGSSIDINSMVKIDISPFALDANNNIKILKPGLHVELNLTGTKSYTIHMIIPFAKGSYPCNDLNCQYIELQFAADGTVYTSAAQLGITFSTQVDALDIGNCGSL